MQGVKGPFGIWTFPILNALIKMSNKSSDSDETIETAKVIRDSSGEVQEVLVIKR